ncbi:Nuclear transcription factor Y subunit B-5 [Hibiscus syriacus]|uniref:Nuclear transcription factor Y subunit B-5 n=1 Tax=Hibiscus syriacus TaxID=106335 RepID=A0A6A3CID5_HIBSY|nr:nuclear transcription factor Y subunit B-4-like [Hibiscus syriacus]KAE8728477.1 Nuclear transcription factor Y subunit B-5 [Hibiscus syriacus]
MVDEEERLLQIANVGRIMKQILPARAKVSKEAKQTMQECATEFISFVTGEASDKCRKENRKTVNGDDICWALGALGFDDYADAIVRYLHKYRELERDKATLNKASCSRTSRDKDEEEEHSSEEKSDHQPHQQTQAPTPSART